MATRTIDLDLVRTFCAIVDNAGFTNAGRVLGRTQSAVSLQLKRLEDRLGGRPLFERGPRTLHLTDDGHRLLPHARAMLRVHDAALAELTEDDVAGRVRLGVPEDFATAHLPGVLAAFVEAHPRVELEVVCDLTLNLEVGLAAGRFDLVLVKRDAGFEGEGQRVWREPLVWVARDGDRFGGAGTLPLVVSPEPCVYRRRATAALDAAGRAWRIAYTSTSLAGAQAAVRAGLGVAVLPRATCAEGLRRAGHGDAMPVLADTEMALLERPGAGPTAHRFAQHIADALERA